MFTRIFDNFHLIYEGYFVISNFYPFKSLHVSEDDILQIRPHLSYQIKSTKLPLSSQIYPLK